MFTRNRSKSEDKSSTSDIAILKAEHAKAAAKYQPRLRRGSINIDPILLFKFEQEFEREMDPTETISNIEDVLEADMEEDKM